MTTLSNNRHQLKRRNKAILRMAQGNRKQEGEQFVFHHVGMEWYRYGKWLQLQD
jgi:hypothetical protein